MATPHNNQEGKAVYQTMVKCDHPDTIKNLTGFRKPNYAYVLLEYPQYNLISDGIGSWGKGLATVHAESRADVIHQVDNIIKKGGRVIDYGNFPKLQDPNPKRAAKAALYSQGSGIEPWGALENHVNILMRGDKNWADKEKEMQLEIDALRAKVQAQAEAKKPAQSKPEVVSTSSDKGEK